jgi:hypothetical protein
MFLFVLVFISVFLTPICLRQRLTPTSQATVATPAMSILPTVLISFLTLIVLLRFLIFPILFRALTNFRVSSFSPLSAYGLEWRSVAQATAVVPTLRVQRLRWAWGGLKGDEVGLIVLRLEGVSFRVKKREKREHDVVNQRAKVSRRL